MADIVMPQLGESVTEGTITRWFKAPGDDVTEDEPLFEVSTDKVDTEVPATMSGVLGEIRVPEGETVDVGTVLAVMADGDGAGEAAAPAAEAPAEAPPARGRARPHRGTACSRSSPGRGAPCSCARGRGARSGPCSRPGTGASTRARARPAPAPEPAAPPQPPAAKRSCRRSSGASSRRTGSIRRPSRERESVAGSPGTTC